MIEVSEDRFEVMTTRDLNTYTTVLTVHRVTLEDTGEYTLTTTNEAGQSTICVSLLVKGERPRPHK